MPYKLLREFILAKINYTIGNTKQNNTHTNTASAWNFNVEKKTKSLNMYKHT